MTSYKIKIQYRGTNYFGWQIQKGDCPTIQGELNNALSKICKSNEIKSVASGRTDAGVHALGQIVRIDLPINISLEGLKRALNSFLPKSIRVFEVDFVSSNFNPIGEVTWKEYIYLFTGEEIISPFVSDLVVSCPYILDLELMKKGLEKFIGEHDFANFYCVGTNVFSTVREIYWADIVRKNPFPINPILNDCYVIHIRGNGLLKQMARLIVGALWNLGRGKINIEQLEDAINCTTKGKVGPVAPAHGLYLKEVSYSPLID